MADKRGVTTWVAGVLVFHHIELRKLLFQAINKGNDIVPVYVFEMIYLTIAHIT